MDENALSSKKIAILGHSGSGKSTLAKELSEYYNIPVLHLDTVNFVDDWNLRDREECDRLVTSFMENSCWIIEGNYAVFRQQERLADADKIIYMPFPRFTCLFRVLKRHWRYRNKPHFGRAPGCREKTDWTFIRWILIDSRTKARQDHFNRIIEQYHNKMIIIRNQRQLDLFKQQYLADQ